jgi:CRISPR/Cas system-associated exonuclease Cas4 (RecB family)
MVKRRSVKSRSGRSRREVSAWSFSAWRLYDTCPKKYCYEKLEGHKQETSKAMQRGIDIHSVCEKYLVDGGRVPKELKSFADEFKALRKQVLYVEDQWAYKEDYTETRWDDWTHCWLRVKVDAFTAPSPVSFETATIIDFKTGKPGAYDEAQLELYALAVFKRYPAVQEVSAELWYLDKDEIVEHTFKRNEEKKLEQTWAKRVRPMFTDKTFKPKPGPMCNWCQFSAAKGGPCKAGGSK